MSDIRTFRVMHDEGTTVWRDPSLQRAGSFKIIEGEWRELEADTILLAYGAMFQADVAANRWRFLVNPASVANAQIVQVCSAAEQMTALETMLR